MNSEEDCIERRAGEMKSIDGGKTDVDLSATTNPGVWAREFNKAIESMGHKPFNASFLAQWFYNAMAAMELRVCAYYESPLRNPATHKDYNPYPITQKGDDEPLGCVPDDWYIWKKWMTKAQLGPPKCTTFSVPTVPGYWYNGYNHSVSVSTFGVDSGHRGFVWPTRVVYTN
jgi:hypothetical protein